MGGIYPVIDFATRTVVLYATGGYGIAIHGDLSILFDDFSLLCLQFFRAVFENLVVDALVVLGFRELLQSLEECFSSFLVENI